tara:strand:- start:1750 stop:2868 length:1119 start_codon:yes stop_codon:yes gene_type:complete
MPKSVNEIFILIKRHNRIPHDMRKYLQNKIYTINQISDTKIKKTEEEEFIRALIANFWPIDYYQYIINLSLKSILNINTFIISSCTFVIRYSKYTKTFLWQMAFNNKFYVFCTERYKFIPNSINKQNIAMICPTLINVLSITHSRSIQAFSLKGQAALYILKQLVNNGIQEYCKSGLQQLTGYDFYEGFKNRFTTEKGIWNIVSNQIDLGKFMSLLSDYYDIYKRGIRSIPKYIENISSGCGMKKEQARKDFKIKNKNIKTAPIKDVIKEYTNKVNEQKKINPLTGGRYLNGYKPSHPHINGNVLDAMRKAPGYAGRQGSRAVSVYAICCIPVIGTPLMAMGFTGVCFQETKKTGSIFQGIKNTCVNLIYER